MHIALWVLQGFLAVTYAASGCAKSVMSKERLIATGQTGVAPFPLPVIRVVAAFEVLGAFGLVLPWTLGIAPVLTPLSAVGLSVFMAGAAVSHLSLGEYKQAPVNALLLAALVAVAAQRFAQLH